MCSSDLIAGSILGVVKGIILIFTIALIIRYLGLLAQEQVEKTTLLIYLVNNNPIAGMFGL